MAFKSTGVCEHPLWVDGITHYIPSVSDLSSGLKDSGLIDHISVLRSKPPESAQILLCFSTRLYLQLPGGLFQLLFQVEILIRWV